MSLTLSPSLAARPARFCSFPKVLDKNMLLSTYMNYLKTKKIEHVWSKDKDSILFSDSEFSVHTDLDVIQLVFGDEVRNSHPRLPFFLWGFDSI